MRSRGRTRTILFTCMAGALATAVATYAGWEWAGSDRAELAQWLMATTSVGALLAAITAAVFAAGALRLELVRDRRLQDERRRSQASLVASWPTRHFKFDFPDIYAGTSGPTTLQAVQIAIRNASPLPVTDAIVRANCEIGGVWHDLPDTRFAVLPPSDEPVLLWVSFDTPCVVDPSIRDREYNIEVGAHLKFRDTSGEVWKRDPLGFLEPASDFGRSY